MRNLLLENTYFSVTKIKNVKEWIKKQIKGDNDIMVCFNSGRLYEGEGQGHVSIIDSVSKNEVVLIDTGYDVPK